MTRKIPIICTLTDPELQERRSGILARIGDHLSGRDELENGFSFSFPADDAVLRELVEVINLERKCCPFLDFKLKIEAGNDLVSLELTGREGAKETIGNLFDWK
ncbi:MAG: hypothetical protein R2747_15550 [Pyrinomonadaceae bacterium]